MLSRPVDSSGDILPVLSPSNLLSGPPAVAVGLQDHLNLFPGDWWEDPTRGNEVLDLITSARKTDRDSDTLAAALSTYLREFPGVQSLSEIRGAFSNRGFHFSCVVHTESGGEFPVQFESA